MCSSATNTSVTGPVPRIAVRRRFRLCVPAGPILLATAVTLLGVFGACAQHTPAPLPGWDDLPALLRTITVPEFPGRDFPVTDFGAVGDGTTDCSGAFARAIDACHGAGGGRVVVPDGVFLTGAIHLKSNVNLHLVAGATIRFSTDPARYLPVVFTRWEGVECMNYSPLVYAYRQENIAVTGAGTLDGQGSRESWWWWKGNAESGWTPGKPSQKEGRARLFAMGEQGTPVADRLFGDGWYLRPNFFQPYACRNVLVEGVTFKDSPMWFLHPVLCSSVTMRGVTVEGLGPNNDGCDPESCTGVLIENCFFNTGDDCIAIKSGRNTDGRRVNVPTERVIIRGCTMREGHGGVVIGSEISGGVRTVFAEDCTMDSPHLERALRIKTNSVRGGIVENVLMRTIRVGQVSEAVVKINYYYEEGDAGPHTPVVRAVHVRDLVCDRSQFPIWIKAYPRSPVTDITFENCTFKQTTKPSVLENIRGLDLVNVTVGTASQY